MKPMLLPASNVCSRIVQSSGVAESRSRIGVTVAVLLVEPAPVQVMVVGLKSVPVL